MVTCASCGLLLAEDARFCSRCGAAQITEEAEWEKAARGTDGRKYPWGRSEPGASRAN